MTKTAKRITDAKNTCGIIMDEKRPAIVKTPLCLPNPVAAKTNEAPNRT